MKTFVIAALLGLISAEEAMTQSAIEFPVNDFLATSNEGINSAMKTKAQADAEKAVGESKPEVVEDTDSSSDDDDAPNSNSGDDDGDDNLLGVDADEAPIKDEENSPEDGQDDSDSDKEEDDSQENIDLRHDLIMS